MSAGYRLALRCEPQRIASTGARVLVGTGAVIGMPEPEAPESAAVQRLLEGPATPAELDLLLAATDAAGRARWLWWMRQAHERGLLGYRLCDGRGEQVAELIPTRPAAPDLLATAGGAAHDDPDLRVQLSRFAFLHRGGAGMVLDCPLASMRAELGGAAVAAVASCAAPIAVGTLASRSPDDAATTMLIAALLAAGLVAQLDADGTLAEDRSESLSQWEFHDLLMHTRTRAARAGAPRGSTFRFAAIRPAPPALREHPRDAWVELPRPDLAVLRAADAPLARVMEDRRSVRGRGAPTLTQLGELLFRTLRVRAAHPAPADPRGYETTSRPYPSAGGMYELTAYLAVSACDGLARGLYRYDPVLHGLSVVACEGADLDGLLRDAHRAAVMSAEPAVAVILAADFERLSWKYEGVAYALMLKNVGVLCASMQLVATAMGMGCCPLGGGDAELLARAIGSDPLEEASVGELILGS